MSTDSNAKTRTRPDAPNTHQLAAELGVAGQLLDRFVRDHPNPTAPIVIGWAVNHGELRIHPEKLRPDVEAWLDDRPEPPRFDTDLEEALRADSLRAIQGGDD